MRTPVPAAFCITDLNMGGAERSFVDLVTRLPASYYTPSVVSLAPRPTDDDRQLVGELRAANISVEFLNARRSLQAPGVIWDLAKLLKRNPPRILQTFLFHANLVGTLAGRLARVPNIITGIRVAERHASWHRWLARSTARLARYHVCVSQSVADFSRQVARLPAERLVVIPSGVDLDRYPAATPARLADLGVAAGRRALLYAGRLEPQKRVDWLLGTAASILAQLPDHDLLIVGRGRQRFDLERLAKTQQIDHRVHFAGWRADVPAILAACDLVLLASRWEGMPHILLEAMASGKPVVTTAVEGVRELLGPDAPNQLVARDDRRGFAAAVVAIARDRQWAVELGQRNRRRVARRFAVDRMVASYVRLYETMCSSPRSRGATGQP